MSDGDRDYDSYLGLGITGNIELFKFGAKEKNYPFRVTNTVSLQYVQFDGIEIQDDFFNARTQKEVEFKEVFAESGVLLNYGFGDGTSVIKVFYEPLSVQVGTYGLAFQYNGFGLTIKF